MRFIFSCGRRNEYSFISPQSRTEARFSIEMTRRVMQAKGSFCLRARRRAGFGRVRAGGEVVSGLFWERPRGRSVWCGAVAPAAALRAWRPPPAAESSGHGACSCGEVRVGVSSERGACAAFYGPRGARGYQGAFAGQGEPCVAHVSPQRLPHLPEPSSGRPHANLPARTRAMSGALRAKRGGRQDPQGRRRGLPPRTTRSALSKAPNPPRNNLTAHSNAPKRAPKQPHRTPHTKKEPAP